MIARRQHGSRCRPAFTVVETLVAIALLILLSSAITAFLFDIQRTRDRLATLGDERLSGALIIDTLEESVRFAIAGSPSEAGISGDRTSLRITSRRLAIDSVSPEPSALRTSRSLDLQFDEEAGTLTLNGETLTDRVRRVVIRYHDDEQWADRFDTVQAGRLPAAIEIAMWFGEAEALDSDAFGLEAGIPDEADLGEGFGLPTPSDIAAIEGPQPWGEPDRRRVIAVPRLRPEAES